MKAYKYLTMSLKSQPQKIVVTGDSGGAAILLETMLQTYAPNVLSSNAASTADNNTKVTENSGKKLPAAMLLVSPVVCAEINSPAWKEKAKHDMVGPKLFRKVFKEYFGTTDLSSTDIRLIAMTHMQQGFDHFIPKNTMMIVGSKETMRDDITEMALRVVRNSNVRGHLVSEDYAHDWYVIRDTVKDKTVINRCDELFGEFVVNALKEAQSSANGDEKVSATTPAATDKQEQDYLVKFTRNGVTMKFSKSSMKELLGKMNKADVSKEGVAKTLVSMAQMTANATGNISQSQTVTV